MGKRRFNKRFHGLASTHLLLAILFLTLGTACEEKGTQDQTHKELAEESRPLETQAENKAEEKRSAETGQSASKFINYRETGDLPAIRKTGIIRFVHVSEDPDGKFPRNAVVSQSHTQLAERLAKKLGLNARFLTVETPQEAIDSIINGEADIIADNVVATDERREILGLTEPIFTTYRVLITGKNGPNISDIKQLNDLTLTVLSDSLIAEDAQRIAEQDSSANIAVREIPADKLYTEFFGSLDGDSPIVSIVADSTVENWLRYRDDIKIGDRIGDDIAIGWAVRKDAKELKNRVNNFLTDTLVKPPPKRKTDWKSIKESGVLRFATHNGPGYMLWKGVLTGLDYDLASKFAEQNDLELQVVVVPEDRDLVEVIKSGEADFAGAASTITEERRKQGVEFSTPILKTSQRILSNDKSPPIDTVEDLNGRTLTLHAHSAFIETAQNLQQSGIDVELKVAPEGVSIYEIIEDVAKGKLEATLDDSDLVDLQVALHPGLITGAVVSKPLPQGWMVTRGNDSLLREINKFLQGFLENKKNRAMVDSYFKPDERLLKKVKAMIRPGQDLSPFDQLAKKYALKHGLDWRLVVAQMWQESNFDPKAESHVGAQGLLQVMPRTAQEMGFNPPLFDPDNAVEAGTKYLKWVRERFEDELPANERLWFALAAYNAGIGHLRDARILAKQLDLDPDKWFDNVEVAMLKLSEPRYFEKARYGYARGAEPALYVRNIRDLYRAYTGQASGDVTRIWCAACAWTKDARVAAALPGPPVETLPYPPPPTQQPDHFFSPPLRAASP